MVNKSEDTYLHKGLRKKLVDTIREKGIENENVLEAIYAIPRHYFFEQAFEKHAYEDKAFPILADQTISQPFTVAYQTSLLEIKRFEKILEIGTGSVYQASVLAEMGAQVFTIERQRKIFDHNLKYYPLKSKYTNIKFFYGDGFEGLPTYAPFDKIIITAAAPIIPDKLIQQLKVGGIMVLPLDKNNHQVMIRLIKQDNGKCTKEEFDNFNFVPMLKGKNE